MEPRRAGVIRRRVADVVVEETHHGHLVPGVLYEALHLLHEGPLRVVGEKQPFSRAYSDAGAASVTGHRVDDGAALLQPYGVGGADLDAHAAVVALAHVDGLERVQRKLALAQEVGDVASRRPGVYHRVVDVLAAGGDARREDALPQGADGVKLHVLGRDEQVLAQRYPQLTRQLPGALAGHHGAAEHSQVHDVPEQEPRVYVLHHDLNASPGQRRQLARFAVDELDALLTGLPVEVLEPPARHTHVGVVDVHLEEG